MALNTGEVVAFTHAVVGSCQQPQGGHLISLGEEVPACRCSPSTALLWPRLAKLMMVHYPPFCFGSRIVG